MKNKRDLNKNRFIVDSRAVTLILAISILCLSLLGCGSKGTASTPAATEENSSETKSSVQDVISGWESNSPKSEEERIRIATEILTPAWTNTGKYHTAWDLTQLYQDENEYKKDYDAVINWAKSLSEFEGTLNTAENICKYLVAVNDEDMTSKFDKMLLYTELGKSLDVTDEYFIRLSDELENIDETFSHSISFASPEIMSIPFEERTEIFSDPLFENMEYLIRYYVNPNSTDYSKEVRDKIADIAATENDGINAYVRYKDSQYKPLDFEYAKGQSVPLNDANYSYLMNGNIDRDMKIDVFKRYTEGYLKSGDDFTSFLQMSVDAQWKKAKLCDYDSTLSYILDSDGISQEVFSGVIGAANKAIPDYQRYLKLHKEGIGLDDQYLFDLSANPSEYRIIAISYDDAIEMIKNAVAPLGEDYLDNFSVIVNGDNIDAIRSENRESGSYTMSGGKAAMPHIFTNYYGSYMDVSALAHEIGHAVNYKYSIDAQPVYYDDMPIFDTEICSILNELLLNAYMVNSAKTDEEKLFYLENLLNLYSNSFFVQCMYSELEDYLYKETESGRSLNTESINKKTNELHKKYRGDAVNEAGVCWMTIDHLHYSYYMYKYATAICYASSIVDGILKGDQNAIDSYKEFMAAGSSANAMDILLIAGIDPEDKATYDKAAKYYSSLIDEYEELLRLCGKIQ